MSENLFGLTVAADPARKHGTYDPQISGADRGCGAVQDPYGYRAGLFIGTERHVLQPHRMASAPDV